MIIIIVTFIPIVIDPLGTVTKRLEERLSDLDIKGQVETTALLRSARILKRVLETWGTCCHSNMRGNPSVNVGVKIF